MNSIGLIALPDKTLFIQHDYVLPELQANQILIRVAYAGINRGDLEQVKGEYDPPAGVTHVLGLECSGVVEKVGADVTHFSVGDRVMALVAGGAFATRLIADTNTVFKIPSGLSLAAAAAVPESLFTFWANAYLSGGLRQNMTFLIHGGASGLGSFSVCLAKALGARVFSSARGNDRVEYVQSLGANAVVNTENLTSEEVGEKIIRTVGENQVDVIMDHLGGNILSSHFKLLKKTGRIVMIDAKLSSETVIDLDMLIVKRIQLIGSVLRSRTLLEKKEIASSIENIAISLMNQNKFNVPLDEIYNLEDAQQAFTRIENRINKGKVLLCIGGDSISI